MSAKYIFRLDDIAKNMDCKKYKKVKQIFIENDVKPIIGVIPNNQDKTLLDYPECKFDFWKEIKSLQDGNDWNIAMHGYNHVYETEEQGILKINNYSEFAGLSKSRQNDKIVKGIKIFGDKGIRIDAFMAPAHSFDETTLDVLSFNKINTVTDGYSLYPYYEKDILFIPQLFSKPRKMPLGIYTWCLHTNTMSDQSIKDLEEFIKKNKANIISFSEAEKFVKKDSLWKLQRFLIEKLIYNLRRLRNWMK